MTLAQSQVPPDYGDPTIEHRFLGLDKRIIGPSLGILALVVFWSAFIPWLNERTEAEPIEPGTVVALGPEDLVEFTPAAGWQSDGPVFPGQTQYTIFNDDGVFFTIAPGAFDGTADELLDELVDDNDPFVQSDRVRFTLLDGLEVVGVDIQKESEEGFIAGIDSDEPWPGLPSDTRTLGIGIQSTGPLGYSEQAEQDVAEMLVSIRVVPADERNAVEETE